jgi:hypothetical protein
MGLAGPLAERTMHHAGVFVSNAHTLCQCTCDDDNARACIHGHTRGLIARAAFIYFPLGWSVACISAHQAPPQIYCCLLGRFCCSAATPSEPQCIC